MATEFSMIDNDLLSPSAFSTPAMPPYRPPAMIAAARAVQGVEDGGSAKRESPHGGKACPRRIALADGTGLPG